MITGLADGYACPSAPVSVLWTGRPSAVPPRR